MSNLNFLFEGVQWDESADAEWKATDGMKMKILVLTNNKQLFCFDFSFLRKYWSHSEMTVEKWQNPGRDQITAHRKHVCHFTTTIVRGIVFPGHYPQITLEQLELLWKPNTAKEKESCWWRRQRMWRERLIETEVKQEWTDGQSMDAERCGVVSKSVPSLICVSSQHRDLRRLKTIIPSTKPADLFKQPTVGLTDLRSEFLDQTGILTFAYIFGQQPGC